ncbi:YlxR family protein [Virgisporangium aliadipatigenens]|uniref:YlxR family protein n=1 Tax=Virgisporangium aliadipatigenens TaxID=741659 RepID=UPI001EF29FAB
MGCRKRAPASELLRIVASRVAPDRYLAVPDPRRIRPGRGAHLHRDQACLALAQRRNAFGRALRVTGVVDIGELAEAVPMAAETGTARGGSVQPHPDSQGRTTGMSTR